MGVVDEVVNIDRVGHKRDGHKRRRRRNPGRHGIVSSIQPAQRGSRRAGTQPHILRAKGAIPIVIEFFEGKIAKVVSQ